jgi:hypothetical protein
MEKTPRRRGVSGGIAPKRLCHSAVSEHATRTRVSRSSLWSKWKCDDRHHAAQENSPVTYRTEPAAQGYGRPNRSNYNRWDPALLTLCVLADRCSLPIRQKRFQMGQLFANCGRPSEPLHPSLFLGSWVASPRRQAQGGSTGSMRELMPQGVRRLACTPRITPPRKVRVTMRGPAIAGKQGGSHVTCIARLRPYW